MEIEHPPDAAVRTPCRSCPWRVGSSADAIPGFSPQRAEDLRATCERSQGLGTAMFACHQSRVGEEIVCAGWLAVHGRESIAVRIAVLEGRVPVQALDPGEDWPPLYADFDAMIANLRATWTP